MASLGVRKYQDLIGRTDFLQVRRDIDFDKAQSLNLSNMLRNALDLRPGVNIVGGSIKQDFQLESRLDNKLLEVTAPVLRGEKNNIHVEMNINNEDRAFTSTLSYYISK